MAQSAAQVLLGDIGGTKARFALLVDGQLGSIETLLVNDYPGIADAIEAFFALHRGRAVVTHACLAIAGPVQGDRCVITNSGWLVDGAQLRKTFGLQSLRLVNDFEATAWSLPRSQAGGCLCARVRPSPARSARGGAWARDRPRHGMFHAQAGSSDRNCFRGWSLDGARFMPPGGCCHRSAAPAFRACFGRTRAVGRGPGKSLSNDRRDRGCECSRTACL